jgi:tetratricopeptide (TPR) repeat protein
MGRPATERITNDIAREICQRENDKATIGGSIASLGRKYVITLQATNCQTGDTLAREQAEAPDKEHVLEAVSKAARGLRHKMGESLNSIQKLQPPMDRVTTASLQAFQLFAQGVVSFRRGAFLEAIPLFRRATELDPNFATAWNYLGVSYQGTGQTGLQMTESLTRAFLLRDRGTERERLMITAQYYSDVTFEWNKAADITELWARTYPRDYVAYNYRGVAHFNLGQLEDALRDFQNEYRIEPRNTFAHGNLIATYVSLEQYDEAKKVAETVLATGETGPHGALLWIALIQGDKVATEQQIRWLAGKPEEYAGRELRAEAATVLGRLREADELLEESSALRQQYGVARTPFSSGPAAALFGSCGQTRTLTDARDPLSSAWLPALLVLCGDAAQTAQALNQEEETATKRQSDVLINAIRLPMLRAASALKHDHPDEAIAILRPVMNYERGRPEVIYLRGLSYLQGGRGAEAAAEFQKIIDHKTLNWGPFYAASHVELARAAAIAGDNARARKAYQEFLTLWKDADLGIPILTKARKEYARLN